MGFTTLLIDADDTLFDFPECEKAALRRTLEEQNLLFDESILRQFSAINAALWKKMELHLVSGAQVRLERFRELIIQCFQGQGDEQRLAEGYIHALSEQSFLIEGTEDALRELSGRFELNVITNGFRTVQRGRFSRTPVSRYIRKLYISDEIGCSKPEKAYFDAVTADIREKDRSKILVVGDSLTSDMQGGKNAGLTTCLFDPKGRTAMPHPLCDYRIDDLMQLITLCRGEGI